jgi:hypothetical protein
MCLPERDIHDMWHVRYGGQKQPYACKRPSQTRKRSATPVKAMERLYQLIASAFAKFLAADLSMTQARFGLYGRWVVDACDQPVPASESHLDQARVSQAAWTRRFVSLPNPYSDLVAFYETGACLGRWENNILDVYDPDGQKVWGIPLKSLVDSAHTARNI